MPIASHVLVKVMDLLVFLLIRSDHIWKGHSELEFRLKLSFSCRTSLLVFSWLPSLKLMHYCNKRRKTILTMISLLSQECERQEALPAPRFFFFFTSISQTYKKIHCIFLENAENKSSKTALAVKKTVLSVMYMG